MPSESELPLASGSGMSPDLERVLANAEVRFGLRAQGKLETVGEMLAEGRSWDEIGHAIGWDGATAKRFYEMESTDA